MSITYFQIVRVLWKGDNIPGHQERKLYSQDLSGLAHVNSRRTALALNANFTTESQLRSRRKAAKMLVAVVIMFAVCYFPVHLLDILRFTVKIPQTTLTASVAMLSHWMCYANSAKNLEENFTIHSAIGAPVSSTNSQTYEDHEEIVLRPRRIALTSAGLLSVQDIYALKRNVLYSIG
ncbi:hypothetical protein RUM43_012915 [Polyplax serrata]|uniref:G-protein coupled receptors family 1 profile domain-containing protein n=1 Tax=Polyplax serrata TaxID=468196 RepID=A0AAN8NYP0_POLSC